jgi:NAD+ kinase
VITPLAPHNLTVRPLVVPNDKVITIKVTGRTDSFLATLDDRSVIIDAGVELRVAKADFEIGLFRMEHHNFFGTLRNKLMWGVDKRN